MFNSYKSYTIGVTDYIDKVFTFLPANAFINKGRCGIGGTTLELKNKNRCSIIVVPTTGILKDKKKSNPDLFIVYKEINVQAIVDQLLLNLPSQKIMTTPEGTKKIMDAAGEIRRTAVLKSNWFLLLDECHSFITEDFRPGILRPFDYFWEFDNKALISATPYEFSDIRFRTLDYYEIKFDEKLGLINLVECKSVAAALNHILKQSKKCKGNLHVFLNSVTEIAKAVKRAELKDCNIYCADDNDNNNMKTLGDLVKFYQEQPDRLNFKKINFYTSKYFEGWDMEDEDATIVLVTDVYNAHTKVPVGMKLKQAAGRPRNKPEQILHLTNHHHVYIQRKSLCEYKADFTEQAKWLIKKHAEYIQRFNTNRKQLTNNDDLKRFADIDKKTKLATLNTMKLDQQINQAYNCEVYNNINLIKEEWEAAYYNVCLQESELLLETNTIMKRKSKAQQLKEDYLAIKEYHLQKDTGLQFNFGDTVEEEIRKRNQLAYDAYHSIDETTMIALSYNTKKVSTEVVIRANIQQEVKLLKLLSKHFVQGQRYSLKVIKSVLQQCYDQLNIRDEKKGIIRRAEAVQLGEPGRFELKECKMQDGKTNGAIIVRTQFQLRMAA